MGEKTMPKGGRKPGSKDRKPRKRPSLETVERLSKQWKPAVGRPSRVIRTHGSPGALEWWRKLDAVDRADWVDWLYQHRHHISRVTEEVWEE